MISNPGSEDVSLLGESPAIVALRREIRKAARTSAKVLILVLAERGLACGHICPDGTIEPHGATEERLLALAGGETDLFRDRPARLAEAYRRRARAVAARLKG